MKKTERPTKKQISDAIRGCITIDLPDGEIDDAIEHADELCDESYDAGYNLGMVGGANDYENENPPINEEKLCADYVIEKFEDCKTLADFQDAYKWIFNTHCNHMPI